MMVGLGAPDPMRYHAPIVTPPLRGGGRPLSGVIAGLLAAPGEDPQPQGAFPLPVNASTLPIAPEPGLPNPATDVAIESVGLRKVVEGRAVLGGLTFTVVRGEVFGIAGPNGAGKSTLLRVLLGLSRPSGGRATMFGHPAGSVAARALSGYLPEHPQFHGWMRAWQVLEMHGSLAGMNRKRRRERIPELLDLVGLGPQAADHVRTFSPGMTQRLGIAQAMLHNPAAVFLDEPLSALDPSGHRDVLETIRALREAGVTVVMVSHQLEDIEAVCDRAMIVDGGVAVGLTTIPERTGGGGVMDVEVDHVTPSLAHSLAMMGEVVVETDQRLTIRITDRSAIPVLAMMIIDSGARLYRLAERPLTLTAWYEQVMAAERER